VIVKCKVCKGSGHAAAGSPFDLVATRKVCPACKGAGEFDIAIPSEKLTTCKFCGGSGMVQSANTVLSLTAMEVYCPACKGLGIVERPAVGSGQTGANELSVPQTPRLSRYSFDIAVSFAGEDREVVQQYCDILRSHGLRVFYDKYERIGLWGANLYDKLDEVYRTKALCCVIFISKHYAAKVWTNHERKSAQARALQENREYVLPVRLDDTEIPSILPTIGYEDLRKISVEKLAAMTVQKVKQLKRNTTSPSTA